MYAGANPPEPQMFRKCVESVLKLYMADVAQQRSAFSQLSGGKFAEIAIEINTSQIIRQIGENQRQ